MQEGMRLREDARDSLRKWRGPAGQSHLLGIKIGGIRAREPNARHCP